MKHNIFKIALLIIILGSSTVLQSAESSIYSAAINNKNRLSTDLQYDAIRKPIDILPFTNIKSGDQVLELGAGGGYTTELLSWLTGQSGKVYAHFLYNQERLANDRLPNVISLPQHSLSDHKKILKSLNATDQHFDAIVIFFVLHDIYLNNEMSDALLATLHKSLKPGGKLIILDNAAAPDSGLAHIGDLHRIGENFVKEQMIKAGFLFDAESNALRNKADKHNLPWGDFKGQQDRFAFRFIKPQK